jgi:hypothetical protein
MQKDNNPRVGGAGKHPEPAVSGASLPMMHLPLPLQDL